MDDDAAFTYPPDLGAPRYLSDDERKRLLTETWASRPPDAALWIFAYGSLIWRPALPVAETVGAVVDGYHRGLCLWSCLSRGTLEAPGLVLALDEGGRCEGVVHRIDATQAEAALATLWARELVMDSYRPRWLACRLADGRRVTALAFVMRRGAFNHASDTPDTLVRHVLRHAVGTQGSALDYLVQTVTALRANGIFDGDLEGLLHRCADWPAAPGRPVCGPCS